MGGPNVDGKGLDQPKEKTPEASVNVGVKTDVPGGESKSGKHIEITGPNARGSVSGSSRA
jgi:hypothetical protein